MALTLVEAAKTAPDALTRGTIQMFARESDILRVLPFETIPGGAVVYNREQALPGIGFRGVNEAFTESTGVVNPYVDAVVIAGGDLDVDRFILETRGQEQRATQTAMKIKALADTWTGKIIKGDSATEPREFDGLQTRLLTTGPQVVSAGSTANGAALSLQKLDEVIDLVDGPTHLIMSKALRRKFSAAARNTSIGGFIASTKDEFGRPVTTYNGLPLLTAYQGNGGTEPLPFTEAAASGTATATSIYVVSFGPGKLMGIQNGTMSVRDLGELQSGPPVFRTRIEWYAGLALYHGRAAARLRHIGDLAIVA